MVDPAHAPGRELSLSVPSWHVIVPVTAKILIPADNLSNVSINEVTHNCVRMRRTPYGAVKAQLPILIRYGRPGWRPSLEVGHAAKGPAVVEDLDHVLVGRLLGLGRVVVPGQVAAVRRNTLRTRWRRAGPIYVRGAFSARAGSRTAAGRRRSCGLR